MARKLDIDMDRVHRLYVNKGKSVGETAIAMGLNPATVAARIKRARKLNPERWPSKRSWSTKKKRVDPLDEGPKLEATFGNKPPVSEPVNGDVHIRKMTPEEWARYGPVNEEGKRKRERDRRIRQRNAETPHIDRVLRGVKTRKRKGLAK